MSIHLDYIEIAFWNVVALAAPSSGENQFMVVILTEQENVIAKSETGPSRFERLWTGHRLPKACGKATCVQIQKGGNGIAEATRVSKTLKCFPGLCPTPTAPLPKYNTQAQAGS